MLAERGRFTLVEGKVLSVRESGATALAVSDVRVGGRTHYPLTALVIPAQVAMIPLFLIMKWLHLVNSYGGVIVPAMASIFGIFLVRQFALAIPQSLLDAARTTGADERMTIEYCPISPSATVVVPRWPWLKKSYPTAATPASTGATVATAARRLDHVRVVPERLGMGCACRKRIRAGRRQDARDLTRHR